MNSRVVEESDSESSGKKVEASFGVGQHRTLRYNANDDAWCKAISDDDDRRFQSVHDRSFAGEEI